MATPNYTINYNDKRFTQVENDKKVALSDNEKLYGNMIGESDKYYQAQIDASKQWADKQAELQQANTDFAIEKIEQQKKQAHTDYIKEQSGAYTDWQKQSNQYGAKAEQMASQGMMGTGFSESSQVSMFNTYQNRVATARESLNKIFMNFDNNIKEAQLQNNSKLAEIYYQAQQQQLELNLQGFQYKNTLLLEQANRKQEIENNYYNRYQDVLAQMNHENALAEQIRQANLEQTRWEKEYALQKKSLSSSGGSSGGGGGGSRKSSSSSKTTKSNKTVKKNSSGTKYVAKETGTEKTKTKGTSGYVSVKKKTTDIKTSKANSVKNKKKVNSLNSIKAHSLLNIKF